MDKVQKYNSFNTNTPSSESYRNYLEDEVPFMLPSQYLSKDEACVTNMTLSTSGLESYWSSHFLNAGLTTTTCHVLQRMKNFPSIRSL
jgi:hypothetical protein